MKRRIWELDAFRGVCLLIVIAVHVTYDLVELFCVVSLSSTRLYDFARSYTGVLFLVLSGLCVTLGRRAVRRGLTVLAGGLCVTAATVGMYCLGMAGKEILIYFGVLHCLGVCMLLWPLLRRCPPPVRLALGVLCAALGIFLSGGARAGSWLLMPLGLPPAGFVSSDYFPLLPNLGYFLVGSFLGDTVYREKVSRLPESWGQRPIARFFCFCGRHSLAVYLLHQPIIYGTITFILYLSGRTCV